MVHISQIKRQFLTIFGLLVVEKYRRGIRSLKEFVVELLVHLFHKSSAEATALMWSVHRGERGVAGIYPREIAESKVENGIELARENGFPLQLSMEPDT